MTEDPDAVVSLEAWRLKGRGQPPGCQHPRSVIDERLGTVECRDCGVTLSAFWVLGQMAREENRCFERVKALRREADELREWVPFLRSMRELEKRWRGRKLLPACPHCHRGLWPDELASSAVSVELERAHRRRHGMNLPLSAEPRPGKGDGRA